MLKERTVNWSAVNWENIYPDSRSGGMFTGRGDSGDTDTADRSRVVKDSLRVEVTGALDETISFIGNALVKSQWDDISSDLSDIQADLFTMGEDIGASGARRTLSGERLAWIEDRTRKYKEEIGQIRLFVMPGGSEVSAALHLARVVSRSAERKIVSLGHEMKISPTVLKYANRLSSVLFMMALVANRRLGIQERIWDVGILS